MKTLLSRSTLLGALLLLPGCASLAQDPEPYRNVRYSAEELDNLVAPVALYPDALLAQILVAATFPEQVAIASRYVRERGTRNIDDQGWDISVKAVAYYPPVLNMLANDEDWSVALGQAYASQSADLMDAVQRLREMAREQGNLVSTQEHTVSEDRGRIIIVPANPQVIYVPTYDPAIVYVRPIFGYGFHTGYFSFGLGFPIGSWLAYDMDWWGHRVYYDGWYGDGWRYRARRYFPLHHVYVRPRYSVVNININIFSRRVNYFNLDRRHRYVRRSVEFERHDRGGRYVDRDGRRDDDRRGPYVAPRGDDRDGVRDGDRRDGGRPAGRGDGDSNDRIGNRVATFDDYRPDRGRNGADARDAEPPVGGSGFGTIDKGNGTTRQPRGNNDAGGNTRGSSADARGSRPDVPVFTSMPRSGERKATGNARPQSDQSGNARPEVPVFRSQPRASEGKSKGNGSSQGAELRSAPRANAPVYSAPKRSTEGKSGGNGGEQRSEIRSTPRSSAPVFSAPQRSVERKSGGGNGGGQRSEMRSAPRSSAPVYSAPQRSVERKSGGGGGGAQFSGPSVRQSSSRPAKSSPSVARSGSGGGSGSFRQSGGAKGGGKGRK